MGGGHAVGGGHAPEAKRQPERLLKISTLAEVAGKAASNSRPQGRLQQSLQKNSGIDGGAVEVGAEMQVWPGYSSRRANGSEGLAERHLLSCFDGDFAQVAVHGHKALAMIEQYCVAIEEVVSGRCDNAGPRRGDGRSCVGSDIHARMR